MSYQTGTVTTPTSLLTIIETFCTTNGWTLNAGSGSWLSKGQSHVSFQAVSTTTLTMSGANSSDGLTELCPFTKSIYITTSSWPINYELFYNSTPDQVVCVLRYEADKIQVIMFGDIVKIHNSAYIGGNWFFASKNTNLTQDNTLTGIDHDYISKGYGFFGDAGQSGIAFSTHAGNPGSSYLQDHTAFHCKIDGHIWGTVNAIPKVECTNTTVSSLFYSPNLWNGQAHLAPIGLKFPALAGLQSYLGYVEHIRYIRIDNYNIGDIITLGTDQWKVYPWLRKNSVYRNGGNLAELVGYTGTLGFAVRYTP